MRSPDHDDASRTGRDGALARLRRASSFERRGGVRAFWLMSGEFRRCLRTIRPKQSHRLATAQARIRSYQDAPKSLAELQQQAGKRRPGYDDRPIVEQRAGDREGFARSAIDASTTSSAFHGTSITRLRGGTVNVTRISACNRHATIFAVELGPSMFRSAVALCKNSRFSSDAEARAKAAVERRDR